MIRVAIVSPQQIVPIARQTFRKVARAVLEGEGVREAEISLAFVDNPTIQCLNKRYLNHDEPTDVLSFPLGAGKKLAGEIVLGVEVALAEARRRGHEVNDELALYAIHGLLHLCGYDDVADKDRRVMRDRERHYLKSLGLPDIAGK